MPSSDLYLAMYLSVIILSLLWKVGRDTLNMREVYECTIAFSRSKGGIGFTFVPSPTIRTIACSVDTKRASHISWSRLRRGVGSPLGDFLPLCTPLLAMPVS